MVERVRLCVSGGALQVPINVFYRGREREWGGKKREREKKNKKKKKKKKSLHPLSSTSKLLTVNFMNHTCPDCCITGVPPGASASL